jgi:hypothetical protein
VKKSKVNPSTVDIPSIWWEFPSLWRSPGMSLKTIGFTVPYSDLAEISTIMKKSEVSLLLV